MGIYGEGIIGQLGCECKGVNAMICPACKSDNTQILTVITKDSRGTSKYCNDCHHEWNEVISSKELACSYQFVELIINRGEDKEPLHFDKLEDANIWLKAEFGIELNLNR